MMTSQELPHKAEDLLQERLEQLETGVPLGVCAADMPPEEAELLQLAAVLRQASYPNRDPASVAGQRAKILRQMDRSPSHARTPPLAGAGEALRSLWDRLQPRSALVGAVALLAVCVIIALVALSNHSPGSLDNDVAQLEGREADVGVVSAKDSPAESTADQTYDMFAPLMAGVNTPEPGKATLDEVRGLVEMQAGDGSWTAVHTGHVVRAGQRLRASGLSSVRLGFYDGSQAQFGPNTEFSIAQLDARSSGGPRVVELIQWSGESDHVVAPASGLNSRYEVRTPFASGVATGTAFRVRVTENQRAHYSVDEGTVVVTGQQTTVNVMAGQTTSVDAGEAPTEPAFRITGEGQVTQIGDTWVIAGQTFETHEKTVIVGNPQVGDWVYVDGHLKADGSAVADWIVLLHSTPEESFTITGQVEAIGEAEWTVAGQIIQMDEDTEVDEGVEIGDLVKVEGVILEGGDLLAREIHLLEEGPGLPFQFTGVVEAMGDVSWTISEVDITIDDETDVDDDIELGDIVEAKGWILEDGTWLAKEIHLAETLLSEFEFTGAVESIDPWVVAGIPFETDESTEIDSGIEVGDLVKVEGQILPDGTWLASDIELLEEEDDDVLSIVFVGEVEEIDPWVVSGIPLEVNEETVIAGDIQVGDLVRVTVEILPDGTWLATRIELLEIDDDTLGCVFITAVVVDVGDGWVTVPHWPPIDLDDVIVEGPLQVGSVILMQVCVAEDGSIDIVKIIVIYQPEPELPPVPEPPSPPSDDDDDGHKVSVCHKPNSKNPHTITISKSALQAHLNHGDTVGPCGDQSP